VIEWLESLMAGDAARGVTALHFEFGAPFGFWLCLLLLAAVATGSVLFYRGQLAHQPTRMRRLLIGLRTGVLVLAAFLLLYPRFSGLRYDPTRNYLLMLFDDSHSMTIPDRDNTPRGERMLNALETTAITFKNRLQERYRLATYSFGDSARRVRDTAELEFDRDETNLSNAVESALRDFEGINVSAVILFSDGIDQPKQSESRLPVTRGVPVITIGTGGGDDWRDLEIRKVVHTRTFGDTRPVTAKVAFSALGLAGRSAVVEILEGSRVVVKKAVDIETQDEVHEVKLELEPAREGWIEYKARIRLEELFARDADTLPLGEDIQHNNSRSFLVDNRPVTQKLLYFSGRPNWENKFVQSALKSDEEIELTSVLRISAAERKFVYRGKQSSLVNPLFEGFHQNDEDQPRYDESVFLRFGGKREDAGKGFPEGRDELFEYDLIVLGDIEARFFSQEQLELVRDFVRKRGGTLLCLGGPHSFTEGKYQDTVIAGLLPVVLSKSQSGESAGLSHTFQATPTVEGLLEGTFALDANPERNNELWKDLPQLVGLNDFAMLRPGATTLARVEAESDTNINGDTFFASQRYGEGRSAVMATGSTWQWHMGTVADDARHGRFWRQLARGLCRDVPEPVTLREKKDTYVTGKRVPLEVLVRDQLFEEKTGMRVVVTLTDPTGQTVRPGVEESLMESGHYTALFQPDHPGVWTLALEARDDAGELVGSLEEALLVEDDRRELQNARYNPERLREMAEATGGRFFELDELATVTDRIPFKQHDNAEVVHIPFWHFPGFFILLVAMMIPEWYLRRKRGFA